MMKEDYRNSKDRYLVQLYIQCLYKIDIGLFRLSRSEEIFRTKKITAVFLFLTNCYWKLNYRKNRHEKIFHSSFWAFEFCCTTASWKNEVASVKRFPANVIMKNAKVSSSMVRKSCAIGLIETRIYTVSPGLIWYCPDCISWINLWFS